MKKGMVVVAAMAAIAIGLHIVPSFYAAGMENTKMEKTWMKSTEVSNLLGREVKNTKGENLGRIKDFVIGPHGRIEFALLSTGAVLGMGGKLIAVPFEALSYPGEGKDEHFSLDVSREQLAKAPEFKASEVVDRSWSERVYRFFGLEPRWSERGMIERGGMTEGQKAPEAGQQYEEQGTQRQSAEPGGPAY
jgi:sporulation protein YlmC with PRC-barrel domain